MAKPMTQLSEELQKVNKEKALLTIEVRQLKKKIEKLEARSKDYLTIYQLLCKHHSP
jgi:hypothetical protein